MDNRIVGLDLLRCIIMFFGPTFHVAMLLNGGWGYQVNPNLNDLNIIINILNFTHDFRMELFFMIAGFFSVLLLDRKGLNYFQENKIKRVFIPALFSIILIVPIIKVIMFYGFNNNLADDLFKSAHIWFLLTLSTIIFVHIIFEKRIATALKKISKLCSNNFFGFLILSIICGGFWFVGTAFEKLFSMTAIANYTVISDLIIKPIVFYGYYLAGCLMFLVPSLNFKKLFPLAFAIFFIQYVLGILYVEQAKYALWLFNKASVVFLIVTIFSLFKDFKIEQNSLIKKLSHNSLIFYILHLPILFIVAISIDGYIDNSFVFASIVILLTSLLSFYLGELLLKFRVVRMIFGYENFPLISRPFNNQMDK